MPWSLLDVRPGIPDPRGRRGRRSPIQSLLAALILAAMNGPSLFQGMGRWARAHSDRLTQHLPVHRNWIPALETFQTLVCRLDWSLLRGALTVGGWL